MKKSKKKIKLKDLKKLYPHFKWKNYPKPQAGRRNVYMIIGTSYVRESISIGIEFIDYGKMEKPYYSRAYIFNPSNESISASHCTYAITPKLSIDSSLMYLRKTISRASNIVKKATDGIKLND